MNCYPFWSALILMFSVDPAQYDLVDFFPLQIYKIVFCGVTELYPKGYFKEPPLKCNCYQIKEKNYMGLQKTTTTWGMEAKYLSFQTH